MMMTIIMKGNNSIHSLKQKYLSSHGKTGSLFG